MSVVISEVVHYTVSTWLVVILNFLEEWGKGAFENFWQHGIQPNKLWWGTAQQLVLWWIWRIVSFCVFGNLIKLSLLCISSSTAEWFTANQLSNKRTRHILSTHTHLQNSTPNRSTNRPITTRAKHINMSTFLPLESQTDDTDHPYITVFFRFVHHFDAAPSGM